MTVKQTEPDTTQETWYTRAEAAALIGRHRDTVKAWQQNGTYVPTHGFQHGQLWVWLYSPEDIERMKEIAKTRKGGRKPKGRR